MLEILTRPNFSSIYAHFIVYMNAEKFNGKVGIRMLFSVVVEFIRKLYQNIQEN